MMAAFKFTAIEARALQQYLADLPDPRAIAATLPAPMADALAGAYRAQEGWRVLDAAMLPSLRRYGLCECGGPYLTNFGTAVRRALMEG